MKMLRILSLIVIFSPAFGLVTYTGDRVVIESDRVIDDDLVVFCQQLDIHGSVAGNVYAFAQNINVRGTVNGTVFTGGADVTLDVDNVGSLLAAGGKVRVSGNVLHNVIIAGGQLAVDKEAHIGKDLKAAGGHLSVDGTIDGNVKAGVGSFIMSGQSGDVRVHADDIIVKKGARINGDIIIESDGAPVIEDGAVITGDMIAREPEHEDKAVFFALAPVIAAVVTMLKIAFFIARVLVGIVLIALAGNYVRRIKDTLITKPWKSLGWGFLGVVIIPVLVIILFAVIIGFPFAVFGVYIYTILLYLSSIFVSVVIGEKIIQLFKKKGDISLYLSLIVGIIILSILQFIPILGFLVKIAVVLFGTGMILVGTWQLIRAAREKELL